MNKDKILDIINVSRKEKWPYSKVFNAFKKAGVESYEVSFDSFEATYHGNQKSWKKPITTDLPGLKISNNFSAPKLEEALAEHQKEKANFAAFLQNAADAGVKGYRVEMGNRTVNYYGIDPANQHCEHVPE